MKMSLRGRMLVIVTIGTLLLLCCALSMCTASLLPRPDTEPAAWAAMAQAASTSRLMGFLGWLILGQGCTGALIPGVIIIGLLATIFWLARPGGLK